jgi:phosphate-selective porin
MVRPLAACVALTTTITLISPPRTRAQAAAPEGWRAEPFKLTSPGGDFEFALAGYAQEDFREYRDWTPLDPTRSELRRLRIGAEGKWKRLHFEVSADPRPAAERLNDTAEGNHHLKDAYLEIRLGKAFRLRGGHFKLPFSPEYLTSSAKTDFIERAVLVEALDLNRDWGAMAWGDLADRVHYELGAFAGDGWRSHESAKVTGAGRLVVTALTGLDLGASYTQGRVVADEETLSDPRAKGFDAEGPAGFQFSGRHFVQGWRRRLGADGEIRGGPISLKGEWARAWEERKGQGAVFEDLPDAVITGWAVSGTWLVTGEKKRGTIRPERPLFHGPGAIEVAARYESLRVDDDGPDSGFAGSGNRARNIRLAGDRVITGGLSWWPRRWMRLVGNVVLEHFEDALLAPEAGRQGYYTTLLGRLQVSLP